MSRFIDLTVTHLRKTTDDAVIVDLAPSDGSVLPFRQGQYLTFRKEIDGVELRRAYSISAGINDGFLQVGIKRVRDGAFSNWANTTLRVGDRIEALSPMGSFHTPLDPDKRRHYLGFAIGSGITPILSIMRSTLEVEPLSRFTLVYANRSINSIMFREEIEDLKNLYMARLNIVHVFSIGQEIDLFSGRLDSEKLDSLFEQWIDVTSATSAFVCGPTDAMQAIREHLAARGMPKAQIKYELFAGGQTGTLDRPITAPSTDAKTVSAEIEIDGANQRIDIAPGRTLLDAALDAGLDAPFACRAGVCSTCRCKVTKGSATMLTNHALEDDELRDGYVLSCQAVPSSDEISVTFTQ